MAAGYLKTEKINAITEDPHSIMLVVEQKKIKFIHSCKKFGSTCTNPIMTIVGLIGQGARAFPKKIKCILSCKKFGGTRTNPTTTGIGLIGQGARAFPIVIDLDKAVTSQKVRSPWMQGSGRAKMPPN